MLLAEQYIWRLFQTEIFCDIRENTPKSYEMGLSPPPHTEKVRSFVTFFYGWPPLDKCNRLMQF